MPMPGAPMQVLLFSHDIAYATAAVAGGVERVVVDWEWRGKHARQAGRDTQVNRGTPADLQAMRAAVGDRVICRINNAPSVRLAECRLALEHGASEIWLPMVRDAAEIEDCLTAIDGRARLGVMVETREAMRMGRELAQWPLSRAYIGLHDYRIDIGAGDDPRELFRPLVDGTIDRFRDDYPGAIAFAGVTRPEGGAPIPQRLLLAAMARVRCAFGVARRGFLADVPLPAIAPALAAIAAEAARLASRPPAEVAADHAALAAMLARDDSHGPLRMESACAC
jgi:hypothetical protein